jgi:hypothetical protein
MSRIIRSPITIPTLDEDDIQVRPFGPVSNESVMSASIMEPQLGKIVFAPNQLDFTVHDRAGLALHLLRPMYDSGYSVKTVSMVSRAGVVDCHLKIDNGSWALKESTTANLSPSSVRHKKQRLSPKLKLGALGFRLELTVPTDRPGLLVDLVEPFANFVNLAYLWAEVAGDGSARIVMDLCKDDLMEFPNSLVVCKTRAHKQGVLLAA